MNNKAPVIQIKDLIFNYSLKQKLKFEIKYLLNGLSTEKGIHFVRPIFYILFYGLQLAIVSFTHLFLKEKKVWQLRQEKLDIYAGFVTIMGASGSGKSTVLSILGGLEKLYEHEKQSITYHRYSTSDEKTEYRFDSKEFNKFRKKDFGYDFQKCYESKALNVWENIALPLFIIKGDKYDNKRYAEELLEIFSIKDLSKKYPNELSGGQLSRTGLLRGFAQKPAVFFIDEPTSSLDETNQNTIMECIHLFQKQTEATVILSTHNRQHAYQYSDQIIIVTSEQKGNTTIATAHAFPENPALDNFPKQSENKSQFWEKKKEKIEKRLADNVVRFGEAEKNKAIATFSSMKTPEPSNSRWPFIRNFQKLFFLSIKLGQKNLLTRADGSWLISLSSWLGFALLFYIFIISGLFILWFTDINHFRGNTRFLQSLAIENVTSRPHNYGFDDDLVYELEHLEINKIDSWFVSKIKETLLSFSNTNLKLSKEYSFKNINQYFINRKVNLDLAISTESSVSLDEILSQNGSLYAKLLSNYNEYLYRIHSQERIKIGKKQVFTGTSTNRNKLEKNELEKHMEQLNQLVELLTNYQALSEESEGPLLSYLYERLSWLKKSILKIRSNSIDAANESPITAIPYQRIDVDIYGKNEDKEEDTFLRTIHYRKLQDPIFDFNQTRFIINNDEISAQKDIDRKNYIASRFSFKNNKDRGVIVTASLLYSLGIEDLFSAKYLIIKMQMEKRKIPIRAIVDSIHNCSKEDRMNGQCIDILTTEGFGKRINNNNVVEPEMQKYKSVTVFINSRKHNTEDSLIDLQWNNFSNSSKNKWDIDYQWLIEPIKLELFFLDGFQGLTKNEWEKLVSEIFTSEVSLEFTENDETDVTPGPKKAVRKGLLVFSKPELILPIAQYLVDVYKLDPYIRSWRIEFADDYIEKIKYTRQNRNIIANVKTYGIILFVSIFTTFLVVFSINTVLTKKTELAKYRAMGGGFWGMWIINFSQLFTLLICSYILALGLVAKSFNWLLYLFKDVVIASIWLETEQRIKAQSLIEPRGILDCTRDLFFASWSIPVISIVIILTINTLFILAVKNLKYFSITSTLKEQ